MNLSMLQQGWMCRVVGQQHHGAVWAAEGPHGTSVLRSLSAVLFLFLLVPRGSRDRTSHVLFQHPQRSLLRDGEAFLCLSGLICSSRLTFSREELTWPLQISPSLPVAPCLPLFVHLQSPDISSPLAKASPG